MAQFDSSQVRPLVTVRCFCQRQAAYKWLSKARKLPLQKNHVAMFNIRQCQGAIALVEVFVRSRRNVKTKVTTHCQGELSCSTNQLP